MPKRKLESVLVHFSLQNQFRHSIMKAYFVERDTSQSFYPAANQPPRSVPSPISKTRRISCSAIFACSLFFLISTALQPLSLAAQFEQETSTDLNKSIGIQSALVKKIQDANTAISKEDYATAFPLLQEILILETDLLLQPEDFPTQANINPLSQKYRH